MDLISIASALWKQKWVTIPVILLIALAALYVVEFKPPVYDSTSTVLLTNPLRQPTQSQLAADPSRNNIFEDYGNLDIVANAVIDDVTSPTSQAKLGQAGAGTAYQLTLSTDYGNPPIIDITGVGSTPSAAVKSAQVLTAAVQQDLASIQLNQGVAPYYLIGGENVVKPTMARSSLSAKLRPLVAVLGAGIIVLFVVVSSADAAARRRRKRQGDIPSADGYPPHDHGAIGALR